jgi:hypothetical protein
MNRGWADAEVALHVGLGRRSSEHARVGVDEGQILCGRPRLTGDIGNVIVVTDPYPAPQRLHRMGEHVVTDVLRFVPELAFKLHADAL